MASRVENGGVFGHVRIYFAQLLCVLDELLSLLVLQELLGLSVLLEGVYGRLIQWSLASLGRGKDERVAGLLEAVIRVSELCGKDVEDMCG